MTREEREVFVGYLDSQIVGAQHAIDLDDGKVPAFKRQQEQRLAAFQLVMDELMLEQVDEA